MAKKQKPPISAAVAAEMSTHHLVESMSAQERQFAEMVAVGSRIAQAFREAFPDKFKEGTCHPATLRVKASDLHRRVDIAEYIKRLRIDMADCAALTRQQLINYLMDVIHTDITEAYDDSGQLLPLSEIPPDVRRMIREISYSESSSESSGECTSSSSESHSRSVKWQDKDKALAVLCRHMGLDKQIIEVDDKADRVRLLAQRRDAARNAREVQAKVSDD